MVVIASKVKEFDVGDVDDAGKCAVSCWREGGGIGPAGTGEVGEGATGNGDIVNSEVGGGF